MDVHTGNGYGDCELDRQFIAWRDIAGDRVRPPRGDFRATGIGQAVRDASVGVRLTGAFDQTVPL